MYPVPLQRTELRPRGPEDRSQTDGAQQWWGEPSTACAPDLEGSKLSTLEIQEAGGQG